MTFKKFAQAVSSQITRMGKDNQALFYTETDRQGIWETYLSSFPEGSNPIYRERTEHDCNCCKNFIRDVGSVVSIDSKGNLTSIWDVCVDGAYQEVADAMSAYVKSKAVAGQFFHEVARVGNEVTRSLIDGNAVSFNHFYATLPNYVLPARGKSVAQVKGQAFTNFSVLKRSVEEISSDSIDLVLDLISQNSLYRGAEHKGAVNGLKKVQKEYKRNSSDNILHLTAAKLGESCRYRNTVIGTLLVDLSDGVELEQAVSSFEAKVAPQNYKRSSSLVTPAMVKKAQQKVEELGIEESLHRRYARTTDLTVNNILFADRSSRKKMGDSVFDGLASTSSKKPSMSKVKEVSIQQFIEDILPKADSLEVFVENKHTPNLVSLIAPQYSDSPNILKWPNNFSWSYAGDVTDSIKERVKKAGGVVDAPVRASLSWFNYDDLDIHVKTPKGYIYFGNRTDSTGGRLDVDMNAGEGTSREAVENVFWNNLDKMPDGEYVVKINNFYKRESIDVGFEVEIEVMGETHHFSYSKPVKDGEKVKVATITKSGQSFEVTPHIESSVTSKEVWNISTQDWTPVTMVLNSPNHWDDLEVGNKHWFFILDGCNNPEDTRGLYNEFLSNELMEHRKVFEVLGSKLKCQHSDEQLSGLGFSSTKTNELLVKVGGSFNRIVKVKF